VESNIIYDHNGYFSSGCSNIGGSAFDLLVPDDDEILADLKKSVSAELVVLGLGNESACVAYWSDLWCARIVIGTARGADCLKDTHRDLAIALEIVLFSFALHAGELQVSIAEGHRVLAGDYLMTRASSILLRCQSMDALRSVAGIMVAASSGRVTLSQAERNDTSRWPGYRSLLKMLRTIVDLSISASLSEGGLGPSALTCRRELVRSLVAEQLYSHDRLRRLLPASLSDNAGWPGADQIGIRAAIRDPAVDPDSPSLTRRLIGARAADRARACLLMEFGFETTACRYAAAR